MTRRTQCETAATQVLDVPKACRSGLNCCLAASQKALYLVPPEVIGDIASRLACAWDSIRVQTRTLGRAEAEPVITQILHARRALPSQWLPSLTVRRLADG